MAINKKLIGGGIAAGLAVFAGPRVGKAMSRTTAESSMIKNLYPQSSGVGSRGRIGRNTNAQPSGISGMKFNFRRR